MSARPPSYRVAAVVAVLLAATVAPSLGPALTATASSAQASASFGERVVYEQRGDVATVTVETSQPATVNIGSPETHFWLQLEVGKGTTELRVNTYKAGESNRYSIGEMVWAVDGNLRSRQLMTPSIDAPLDSADYHMNVTINGNEHAIGTLFVQERSTRGIEARIAPRTTKVAKLNTEDGPKMSDVSVSPPKGEVAHDEWLFVHVDATGVRGALSKGRLDGDGGIMRVDFRQSNPPMNGQGNDFTGASVEDVLTPDGTEGFYLVVDTGDHDIEPGDRYEMSFTVPESSPLADERENVSAEIKVVERRVDIDRKGPGNEIVVEGKTTITGSTTLTPGTTINISARDPDLDPFLIPRTVTVSGDRTFSVTMDFSGLEPGREFEIRLTDQKRTIPAVVAGGKTTTVETTTEPPPTTTESPTTTETTTPEETSDGSGDDGSDPTTTTTTTTETTFEGLTQVGMGATQRPLTQQAGEGNASEENSSLVPGFGSISAVVALLAVALLAIRRR